MERQADRVIECIASENYNSFCGMITKYEKKYRNRRIAIFGAGIMGLQFAAVLENMGYNDFVFCDNDENKAGKMLAGHIVLFAPDLFMEKEEYFIFIAIENYEACVRQLLQTGLQEEENFCNLTNCSEKKMTEHFMRSKDSQILILGDCTMSSVSMLDESKESISDLLSKNDNVELLALNGLYMRSYYNLLRMNIDMMPNLQRAVILLNIDVFENRYHLYPNTQHLRVFEILKKIGGKTNEELEEFLKIAKSREMNKLSLTTLSPDRMSVLSETKMEQNRRVHMMLNYLFEIDETGESMEYLQKFLKECAESGIEGDIVILPVNYEMGEKYFGDRFYEQYGATKKTIEKCARQHNGKILDLSYSLPSREFICLRSTNEGIRERGRRTVVSEIESFINQ